MANRKALSSHPLTHSSNEVKFHSPPTTVDSAGYGESCPVHRSAFRRRPCVVAIFTIVLAMSGDLRCNFVTKM